MIRISFGLSEKGFLTKKLSFFFFFMLSVNHYTPGCIKVVMN